jgi:nucleoside-diphosphate-sugar epimerase
MTKILVTGAQGFVGTALCEELQRRRIPFVRAVRQSIRGDEFPVGDLNDVIDWSRGFADCDTVVHLAARVHIMKDEADDPLAAFRKVNVDATLNLAREAARHGIKRFVFVSSVKVNGEETKGKPFTVSDDPAPLDAYGMSKLEAEIALREISRTTGLELVVVRPPLIYGPGVQANFLRLMRMVRLGIPLPFGAVKNRRSLVAITNLVDFLILCSRHPDARGKTFLVSDNHDVSIVELVRMLASAMRKRVILISVPATWLVGAAQVFGKDDVASRLLGSLQVDLEHTKTVLDWQPPISMEAAVDQTVEAFLRDF